jgi:molecular chaperone IbpA
MSKQIRVTSDLFNSPLYKMSVGFDKMFDNFFDNAACVNVTGYPPYNVAKMLDRDTGDETYEITLAIAGFTESDIEILVENSMLKISGKSTVLGHDEEQSEVTYIYKGIAERNFSRTFRLAEHVEVKSATLKDGILRIVLYREVPETAKTKVIAINRRK